MSQMIPEIPASTAKFLVGVVVLLSVVILSALGKIPPNTLEYVLFWAIGAAGGSVKLPFFAKDSNEEEK